MNSNVGFVNCFVSTHRTLVLCTTATYIADVKIEALHGFDWLLAMRAGWHLVITSVCPDIVSVTVCQGVWIWNKGNLVNQKKVTFRLFDLQKSAYKFSSCLHSFLKGKSGTCRRSWVESWVKSIFGSVRRTRTCWVKARYRILHLSTVIWHPW